MNPLKNAFDVLMKMVNGDPSVTWVDALQAGLKASIYLVDLVKGNPVPISQMKFMEAPTQLSFKELVEKGNALVPEHLEGVSFATGAVPAWVLTLLPVVFEILKKLLNNAHDS